MKLNLDVQDDAPRSAADKLSYQVAQSLGQIMQLLGISSIGYTVSSKGFLPNKVKVSHMDSCPAALCDIADDAAIPLAYLMHEFNLTKLSYEYGKKDLEILRPTWDNAATGIQSEELLVAPEVTPDMEKVEIDI